MCCLICPTTRDWKEKGPVSENCKSRGNVVLNKCNNKDNASSDGHPQSVILCAHLQSQDYQRDTKGLIRTSCGVLFKMSDNKRVAFRMSLRRVQYLKTVSQGQCATK